jgi:hypothetical protein|tara:strand:- start:336 stop:566 length:231 start_codon:yes stop_codon:yes gene_type:complete
MRYKDNAYAIETVTLEGEEAHIVHDALQCYWEHIQKEDYHKDYLNKVNLLKTNFRMIIPDFRNIRFWFSLLDEEEE